MTARRLHLAALAAVAATAVAVTGLTATTTTSAAPAPAPVVQPEPTVAWTDADAVMAGTSTSSTSTLFRFSSLVAGKPVRWNPCAPIHWKFRTTGAPAGAGRVTMAAVARVAKLTGTRWVFDGVTTATPTSSWLPKSTTSIRPVLIGWTDARHSDLLRNQPRAVLGVTRTAYFGATVDGRQVAATKAAVIALDRTDRLPLTGPVSWRTTLLHELGHGMGLNHVSNPSQLMNAVLGRTLTDFGYGDKLGLARVGRSAGCVDLGF